ncbi:uncharacterized protein LOC135491598 [Lineus longissimus]|uniref:uncharacterized protein LOC135491598 n=1 Tax=Lineus longissimus TaxID=88925 RepID=UPI00315D5D76
MERPGYVHKDEQLGYKDVQETFWTDSKVVLGYISNEACRFHVFVANRVQKIRDVTKPEQWHHIATKENPADLASRGVTAMDLINTKQWWKGPIFLSKPGPIQPNTNIFQSSQEDPEMKKVKVLATQAKQDESADFLSRLDRFSSWHRMKRAVAVCLRMTKGLRDGRIKKHRNAGDLEENLKQYKPVDVAEIENTELVIMKMVQAQAISKEITQLC